MARIEIAYVKAYKDRHGRMRYYYRRKGLTSLALPGAPGTAEFMAAYAEADARAPRSTADQVKAAAAARVQPRSINALIIEYYRTPEFIQLADSTRRAYRGQLDRFRARHGDKGALSIQTNHIEAIFNTMATTPEAAFNLRKRLRRVFRLAVRLGWRKDNPVTETEITRRKDRGIKGWDDDQIARCEAHWASGSRERLALALCLYTGQRRSDVVRMGRQHIRGGRISVVQQKTAHRLSIKIHPKLAQEIALHAAAGEADGQLTLLRTLYGKPFSVAGFGTWFGITCDQAGLKGKSAHGLRKSAGRRLAEAGCTEKQIAAVLGHTSLGEVARYTAEANQVGLADDAMDTLEKSETRTTGV
ncbi:tyrosine-type recombinase/integrase [Brevundimonas sp. DC300-4]|uniref:tyrosine-type recombinase/integrase n=1 Tax=Brevundimonas sp. DC300-4 TaxID=2804594 RepID=UPI003CF6D423